MEGAVTLGETDGEAVLLGVRVGDSDGVCDAEAVSDSVGEGLVVSE